MMWVLIKAMNYNFDLNFNFRIKINYHCLSVNAEQFQGFCPTFKKSFEFMKNISIFNSKEQKFECWFANCLITMMIFHKQLRIPLMIGFQDLIYSKYGWSRLLIISEIIDLPKIRSFWNLNSVLRLRLAAMETIKFIQVGFLLHMTGVKIVAAFIHKFLFIFFSTSSRLFPCK